MLAVGSKGSETDAFRRKASFAWRDAKETPRQCFMTTTQHDRSYLLLRAGEEYLNALIASELRVAEGADLDLV